MSLPDSEKIKNVASQEDSKNVESSVETGAERLIHKLVMPRLVRTMRASLSIPKGILEADQRFKDRYASMELPYSDSLNIAAIWRSANNLRPNEFIRLTGSQISSFRMSSFFLADARIVASAVDSRKNAEVGTMREQNGDRIDPSTIDIPALGSFQHATQNPGGWGDLVGLTAVDVYDGLVKELGIDGAPSYKQLLENGFLESDKGDFFDKSDGGVIPDISYRSSNFTASQLHPSLQVYFSMDGYFPDSEMDNDISYEFGVCVHPVEGKFGGLFDKKQVGGAVLGVTSGPQGLSLN